MADNRQLPGLVSGSIRPTQLVSSQFGDTAYTKVFVGGLAWETQNETLHRHFEQYGEILEAVVFTDKNTGRSKGYGFVTFDDPESARKACVDPSPVIDGRRANCNLASLGRLRPSTLSGRLQSGSPYFRSVQGAQVAFVGSPTGQQPVSYGCQQGYAFPSYGMFTALTWVFLTFRCTGHLTRWMHLFIHSPNFVSNSLLPMAILLQFRDMQSIQLFSWLAQVSIWRLHHHFLQVYQHLLHQHRHILRHLNILSSLLKVPLIQIRQQFEMRTGIISIY